MCYSTVGGVIVSYTGYAVRDKGEFTPLDYTVHFDTRSSHTEVECNFLIKLTLLCSFSHLLLTHINPGLAIP